MMFTGLVEALGTIGAITDDGQGGKNLTVFSAPISTDLAIGESVAVNGACLTVVSSAGESFRFQLGPETMLKTNLGALSLAIE